MAWTYTGTPSSTAPVQTVRYLIGDTVAGSTARQPTLSDGEIAYEVAQHPSVRRAAAASARALAAKFARYPTTKQVGDLAVTYGERRQALDAIATSLDSAAALDTMPSAGGISIADKDAVDLDSDRVAPSFTSGMHEHPGARGGHGRDEW